ncbi:MAG: hypothetical protein OEV89_10095 [Desulfobulbaceae bacterium]|nr:hypothetical protein [Desulfobulbaceae bacterium]HIJ91040.1 hypothetical protein [Deltaproteobacteria bacterium]
MGRYFFISGCAVALLHFGGITSAEVLGAVVGFLVANHAVLVGGGLFGVLALVFASLLLRGGGFFNILYAMARVVYELVQLLLCAMSLAALVFWFDLGVNFWLEGGGTLALILYAWFYGAAFSLHVFDFNYPVKEALLSYSTLPFVCLVVIWLNGFIPL